MRLMQAIVQEERFILILFHKTFRLLKEQLCHILIFPLGGLASFLETNSRYTVYDSAGMPDTREHSQ